MLDIKKNCLKNQMKFVYLFIINGNCSRRHFEIFGNALKILNRILIHHSELKQCYNYFINILKPKRERDEIKSYVRILFLKLMVEFARCVWNSALYLVAVTFETVKITNKFLLKVYDAIHFFLCEKNCHGKFFEKNWNLQTSTWMIFKCVYCFIWNDLYFR